MEQLLIGGCPGSIHLTTTKYAPLANGGIWDGPPESDSWQLVSTDGVIKHLRIALDWNAGAGKSFTFTLIKNGAPTALQIVIAGAVDQTGVDLVNEIAVTRGDLISLEVNPDGAPNVVHAWWSAIFEGDNANESLLPISSYFFMTADTYYTSIYDGSNNLRVAPESKVWTVMPTDGTIKNLCAKTDVNVGAGRSIEFTLRKNGADTPLTCTMGAAELYKEDVVNEVAVVAGDYLTTKVIIAGGTPVSTSGGIGYTFVADIDGESLLLGGSYDDLQNISRYNYLARGRHAQTWTGSRSTRESGAMEGFTLKKLFGRITVVPGGGTDRTFVIMNNGADTAMTMTFGAGDLTASNIANEEILANWDKLVLSARVTGAPAIADGFWGLVAYKEPVAPGGGAPVGISVAGKMIAGRLI